MNKKKEFIVWGISPKEKDESVLYTKATSQKEAEAVIKILETKHGCKKCRIQIIDFSKDFNLKQTFSETLN